MGLDEDLGRHAGNEPNIVQADELVCWEEICSMYSGPASISRLTTPEKRATLPKARRHSRKAAASSGWIEVRGMIIRQRRGIGGRYEIIPATGEAIILRHEIPATRSSRGHDCGSL